MTSPAMDAPCMLGLDLCIDAGIHQLYLYAGLTAQRGDVPGRASPCSRAHGMPRGWRSKPCLVLGEVEASSSPSMPKMPNPRTHSPVEGKDGHSAQEAQKTALPNKRPLTQEAITQEAITQVEAN